MSPETSIRVWEPSRHPRRDWPITVSIPFARGRVQQARQVILRDPRAAQISAQRRVLATWPDGSVKWLLVDFRLDLDPLEEIEVAVEIADEPVGVDAHDAIRIEWAGQALRVDTGPMSFELSSETGGLIQRLTAHGQIYCGRPGTVLVSQPDGRLLGIDQGPANINVEEDGPQRSVIRVDGKHYDVDSGNALDYTLRFTVFGGQAMIRTHYTLTNREESDPFPIRSVQLVQPVDLTSGKRWAFIGTDREKYTMPEGWCTVTTDGLETRATDGHRQSRNLNTIRAEVQMEPFMVLGDDVRMITVLPRWAHFLYPKALHYYGNDLRYDIWPDTAETWQLRRGMAKTHEMVLRFSPPCGDTYDGVMPEVAPVLRPVVPTQPPDYTAGTDALPGFFPAHAKEYPLLETMYARQFQTMSRAYGMLHYGDAPGTSYTAQGRGRGGGREATIWVNNEYDMPYMAMVQFLRSRDRDAWLQTAEPHVWHMMDVDTMHFNPDHPTDEGGQVHHLANHVGPPGYGVDPSHEWAEGLILYHLLTGCEHAREHALAMGDHLVAWTEEHRERLRTPFVAARVSGWLLIALTALYEFTHDQRYLDCCIEHCRAIKARTESDVGYLTESVSYGFPYRAGFMTDLAVVGIKRVWDVTGDDQWKELALGLIDDNMKHLTLDTGLPFYKQLPENHRPMISSFDLHVCAIAWEWTREKKYLEYGARLLQSINLWRKPAQIPATFLVEAPEGALHQEVRLVPRDSHAFLSYRFELPFLKVLHELDLLKQFEPSPLDLSDVE